MRRKKIAPHHASRLTKLLLVVLALAFGYVYEKTDAFTSIEGVRIRTSVPASRLEIPRMLDSGSLFLRHDVLLDGDSVMNYCMEYVPDQNHTRWVAFRFDGATRAKGSGRSDAWAEDPLLPEHLHVGTRAYPGGTHSRGHLCASHDRQFSREANKQTFYMTNMSPMLRDFNANYWTRFERFVQNKGRDEHFSDTLYVVKGGTIGEGQTDGTVLSSNGTAIPVPRHYFMALLRCKDGRYSALGFWVEHRNYGYDSRLAPYTVLAQHAVTIDQLETLTGIDFFPSLPDDVEERIESEPMERIRKVWGL